MGLHGLLGALAAARIVLPGGGFTVAKGYPLLSLTDEPTRRAFLGTVLYLGLLALLSIGVGLVVRHTATAISVVLGLLFVFPAIGAVMTNETWRVWTLRLSPMTAGTAIQSTVRLERLPIGPWPGLGLLALYAFGVLLVGSVLFVLRDA